MRQQCISIWNRTVGGAIYLPFHQHGLGVEVHGSTVDLWQVVIFVCIAILVDVCVDHWGRDVVCVPVAVGHGVASVYVGVSGSV